MTTDFAWHRRAGACIGQSYGTNSKRPESYVKGVYPTHATKASGAFLWGTDGKRYLDFVCGLGTNLLGYSNERLVSAVSDWLRRGWSHSLGTTLEVETAEKLKELFPFVDAFKFLKSGSEACSAAVKMARAYHGVQHGTKDMLQVWAEETAFGLSPKGGGSQGGLQGLCPEGSQVAEGEGDKKAGSASLREDTQGGGDRKASREGQVGQGEGFGQDSSLLQGAKGSGNGVAHQDAVRNLWLRQSGGAPRGLPKAASGSVAVRPLPCGRARWLILSDGYHGHHDQFSSLIAPGLGVPSDLGILPLKGNEDLIPVAAAVIIEPVITDFSDARRAELVALREACTKAGTVLIFDEVITGFRWPRFSVAGFWNIRPDLICIGKAMAGGLPLAAVGGSYDLLSGREYFVSSTYAGETLSLAACKATCHALQTNYPPETLWERGTAFLSVFNSFWPEGITIEGYPSRGILKGEPLHKALFMQEACKAGMLFGPSWFLSFPAADQAPLVLEPLKAILHRIRGGNVQLEGELPTSPFAQKVRHGSKP